MLSTLIISLREFLEVFLIIGVFLGISKKLSLKREKEILFASIVGIVFSLILPTLVYMFGGKIQTILNKTNAELIQAYLMIFSGFFIAYVVFSLHKIFASSKSKKFLLAREKLGYNVFDFSLFLMIVFFIMREGFEIALFTATVSLLSRFMDNMLGLFFGFAVSGAIGYVSLFIYIQFPIKKIFRITELLIVFVGASLVKNGVGELVEQYLHINISTILSLHIPIIPPLSSYSGHMLNSLFGIEQDFSLVKLAIMIVYVLTIYFFFFSQDKKLRV